MKPTQTEISKAAAALGRKGGSIKSDKKAASSRENGKLGGRPKTTKTRIGYISENQAAAAAKQQGGRKMINLNKKASLEHELMYCSDLNRKKFLIRAIDKLDNILLNANNKKMAGQQATTKIIFGEFSRYSLFAVHTRFEHLCWLITDGETADEYGLPKVIGQYDSYIDAIQRINKIIC